MVYPAEAFSIGGPAYAKASADKSSRGSVYNFNKTVGGTIKRTPAANSDKYEPKSVLAKFRTGQ